MIIKAGQEMEAAFQREVLESLGQEMYTIISDLYPICRSITGKGLRESHNRLAQLIPLEIHEIPSGTQVFDWTIPNEWNILDAYILDPHGEKIVDFQRSNLHVMSYSRPVYQTVNLDELKQHLHSLPEHPDWIPYKTSYYTENWGFCLEHRLFETLVDGDYQVCIDSTLQPGSLTYGECYLKGEIEDEIVISTHCCHPSLCNDNLSGMALTTVLARQLSTRKLRYSYRFLFLPVTIGAIAWLQLHQAKVSKIKHGLVVAGVGDPGKMTYKKSRRGDAEIDRAAAHILSHANQPYEILDFIPYGYDERQYCSPGFNLPFGSLTRTPFGQYPEYHTSADNLSFVQPAYLADSFSKYWSILHLLEKNKKYINQNPNCEPQLGKRGLYSAFGGKKEANDYQMAMLWVLNYSDGYHALLDIAERSGLDFNVLQQTADILVQHQLLQEQSE